MNIGRVKKEGSTESVQYFYEDHVGSRRAVTDGSGNVQAKLEYSVWGVYSVTNYGGYEGSSDVSYTGKERDQTGLYYFNARYYDASLGRFITEDPARNGMNWFVYCGNNPLSRTDPTGLRYTVDAYDPSSEEDVQELEQGAIGRMYKAAGNFERRGELEEARYLKTRALQKMTTLANKNIKIKQEINEAYYQKLINLGFTILIGNQVEVGRVWDNKGGNGFVITIASGVVIEASLEIPGLSDKLHKVINLLFSTGATSTFDKINGTINDFSGPVLYTEGKLIFGYSMDLHTGEFTDFTSGLSVGGGVYKGYKFIFSY